VPIGDRPVLEHIIRSLVRSGVDHIDLCVNHLGELILIYLANADISPQIRLTFHWESEPLGTAGRWRWSPTSRAASSSSTATSHHARLLRAL
jgi:NDP-sugar pyrophosphorylase family protein